MFLNNTAKDEKGTPKDIKLNSHEGFIFAVPPGISLIWDSAGEALLKVHRVETLAGEPRPAKCKYGYDNGHGIPALFRVSDETLPPKYFVKAAEKTVCTKEEHGFDATFATNKKTEVDRETLDLIIKAKLPKIEGFEEPQVRTAKSVWEEAGKKLARVERYQVNYNLIPRKGLIKIAIARKIPKDRCMEYQIDETVEKEEIAREINELPIPNEVKNPLINEKPQKTT